MIYIKVSSIDNEGMDGRNGRCKMDGNVNKRQCKGKKRGFI